MINRFTVRSIGGGGGHANGSNRVPAVVVVGFGHEEKKRCSFSLHCEGAIDRKSERREGGKDDGRDLIVEQEPRNCPAA